MANEMREGMKKNKELLISLLKEYGADCSFCLQSDKEDTIDIDYDNEQGWYTYLYTRGRRSMICYFDSFCDAAKNIIETEIGKTKRQEVLKRLSQIKFFD